MFTAAHAAARTRPLLVKLIEAEKRVHGCTVKAVKSVAKQIGTSKAWVYRVTGRSEAAIIRFEHWLNIKALHARITNNRPSPRYAFAKIRRRKPGLCDVGPADALAYIPEDFL